MVRALSNAEIRQCLDMQETIDVLERAYRAEADGRAVNIPRSDMILPLGTDEAYVFKVMPGAIEDLNVAAIRMQSDRIRWTEHRKTKLSAAGDDQYAQHVLVYDTELCKPILLIPDGFVSKMRVGATNALGAKYMAPRDVQTVGLLGAGRQAGGQVWGFDTVFELDEIRVYSPTPESREAFVGEWNPRLDADIVAVDSPDTAAEEAEVLATATNSMTPVFDPDLIRPGMHVSTVKNPEVPEGAFDAVDRVAIHSQAAPEGPHNYTPRGSTFAERLEDAWGFETDLRQFPELADLVSTGPGRENADETTMFLNNNGTGIQWAACGRHIHDRAAQAGLGRDVDTGLFLQSVW